jgi:AraC-like DNA-binding protein
VEYVEREPPEELRDLVRRLWATRGPVPYPVERILPTPAAHLIVNLAGPYAVHDAATGEVTIASPVFCSGVQRSALISRHPGVVHNAGAVLAPHAPGAFGIVPEMVTGAVLDVTAQLPALAHVAATHPGAGNDDLGGLVDNVAAALIMSRRHEVTIPDHVITAVRFLIESPQHPVHDVATRVGVTHKVLIDDVRRTTGITPKALAALARFDRLIEAIPRKSTVPWADLAIAAGYYDQSHAIRDFRQFTGMTPSRYATISRRFGPEHARFLPAEPEVLPDHSTS